MSDWEKIRDWEVAEAISSLEKDSYDFVGRDIWLSNSENEGYKADFLRYRRENYMVEAVWIYSEERGVSRDEVMDVLRRTGDLLESESFRPRMSLSTPDSAKPGYQPSVEGNYFFDYDADQETIVRDLEDITAQSFSSDSLSEIECKR